jgi:hypothetical protein
MIKDTKHRKEPIEEDLDDMWFKPGGREQSECSTSGSVLEVEEDEVMAIVEGLRNMVSWRIPRAGCE